MDEQTTSAGQPAEAQAYTGGHETGGHPSTEPDVLLDVPQLRVDEIVLDVEDLRAHVSVQADVLNLLRLSVGADVQPGGVHLEIKGVEAQVLLKVRLDKVAEIINRVLSTSDRNPELVGQIVPSLGEAAGELGEAAGGALDELGGVAGEVAPGLGSAVTETIGDSTERVGTTAEEATAGGPERESAASGAGESGSRGLRRRRKRERTEEPPP
jgi:hypothetical protein